MLELLGMRSTPLLPSLPGPFWPVVLAPDRVLSMDQKSLTGVLMINQIILKKTAFDIENVLMLNRTVKNKRVFLH